MTDKDNKFSRRADYDSSAAEQEDKLFFGDMEDMEGFEEPDRDTDYAAAYREDHLEDEAFADTLYDEKTTQLDEDISPRGETTPPLRTATLEKEWQETAETEPGDVVSDVSPAGRLAADQPEQEWQDEEDYPQHTGAGQTWPPLLIAMAVLAVLLLVAGGYGVLQQRSATQAEIRELQAALATSVDPAAVAEERQTLENAQQRNGQLQSVIDALTLENRRLTDTVAGLERQLQAQQVKRVVPQQLADGSTTAAATAAAATAAAAESADAAASRAPAAQAALPVSGDWFVNFASYGVRETAESWADRIEPTAGKAAIVMGSKGDRSFYRVRVVDLPDRAIAERVATELAAEHGLAELWVGRR